MSWLYFIFETPKQKLNKIHNVDQYYVPICETIIKNKLFFSTNKQLIQF